MSPGPLGNANQQTNGDLDVVFLANFGIQVTFTSQILLYIFFFMNLLF